VKFVIENRLLTIAVAASVLVHAALLAVHFAAPDAFRLKPDDPGLEVILVNAKHNSKPVKAEALAQANLDGGGNAGQGRAKSPLPDMRKVENGDSVRAAQRKVAELEAQQRKILAQMNQRPPQVVAAETEKPHDAPPQIHARDLLDTSKAVARMEAEVAKNIEEYNKRPKKTQITPSTREVGYALYYKAMQDKIEKSARSISRKRMARSCMAICSFRFRFFTTAPFIRRTAACGSNAAPAILRWIRRRWRL